MSKTNRKRKLERRRDHDPEGRKRAKAIKAIHKELDIMDETYSGCDWCCGGGDERKAALLKKLEELGEQ